MDEQRSEEARSSYNRLSGFYGLLSSGSEKRFVKEAVDRFLEPGAGELLLEPGFGSGRLLVALAERVGPAGRVYGIDISDGMVAVARKRVSKSGLEERVLLTRGDACEMPYEGGFFDGAFISFTLELFPDEDIPRVLGECMRVLKPGGRLCVAGMSDRGKKGLMTRLYLWSHRRFPRFVNCRPIFVEGALHAAGFYVAGGERLSMWGLPVEVVLGRKEKSAL